MSPLQNQELLHGKRIDETSASPESGIFEQSWYQRRSILVFSGRAA